MIESERHFSRRRGVPASPIAAGDTVPVATSDTRRVSTEAGLDIETVLVE